MMAYTIIPTVLRKEEFANALQIEDSLVIESPRATVLKNHIDGFFFKTVAALFNERRGGDYENYEFGRKLKFLPPALNRLRREELLVFKYIYMPASTVVYAAVRNGIACFDLMAGTLEFSEITELPDVPKEPFGAEHIWYLLNQLPFRHSRKPSEWRYSEGETLHYGDIIESFRRRDPCPAGTDFTEIQVVKFDLSIHNPIGLEIKEIKGRKYLSIHIDEVIDDLMSCRIPDLEFEVQGRQVIYGQLGRSVGIYVDYGGPLTEKFEGPDILDEPFVDRHSTFFVGDMPGASESEIESVVSALSLSCTFTNKIVTNNPIVIRALQKYDMLRALLEFPYNSRLQLLENGKRRYMLVFDEPQPFKDGVIVFKNNIFCPSEYQPSIVHHPVEVVVGGGNYIAYPAFECSDLCVYMTRRSNSTQQLFFLFDREQGNLVQVHGARIGACKELGAWVDMSKDSSDLSIETYSI